MTNLNLYNSLRHIRDVDRILNTPLDISRTLVEDLFQLQTGKVEQNMIKSPICSTQNLCEF